MTSDSQEAAACASAKAGRQPLTSHGSRVTNDGGPPMHTLTIDRSLPKPALYEQIAREAGALIEGESNWIANLANITALLYHTLHSVNWRGFDLLGDATLMVGALRRLPGCKPRPIRKGGNWTAVRKRDTIVVQNVPAIPGDIACDSASVAEIVVTMLKDH